MHLKASSSSPTFSDVGVDGQSTPPRASTPPTEDGADSVPGAADVPSDHVHSFVCGRLAARGYTARCEANEAERATATLAAQVGGSNDGGGASGIGPSPIMTFGNEMLSPGLSPVVWGSESYGSRETHSEGGAATTHWSNFQCSRDAGLDACGKSTSIGSASPEEQYGQLASYAGGGSGDGRGGDGTDDALDSPPVVQQARLPAAGTPKVVRHRDLPGIRSGAAYRPTRDDLLENPFNSPRLRRKGNRRFEVAPTDFAAQVLSQPIEELQPITTTAATAAAAASSLVPSASIVGDGSSSSSSGGGAGGSIARGVSGGDMFGEVYAATIPEELYAEFGTSSTLLSLLVLKEVGSSLGITISGGTSISPKPGIYVMAVTAGGAAAREGTLRPHDRILSVDRIDMRNANRPDAVSVLKNGGTEVRMIVARMRAKGPPPATRL